MGGAPSAAESRGRQAGCTAGGSQGRPLTHCLGPRSSSRLAGGRLSARTLQGYQRSRALSEAAPSAAAAQPSALSRGETNRLLGSRASAMSDRRPLGAEQCMPLDGAHSSRFATCRRHRRRRHRHRRHRHRRHRRQCQCHRCCCCCCCCCYSALLLLLRRLRLPLLLMMITMTPTMPVMLATTELTARSRMLKLPAPSAHQPIDQSPRCTCCRRRS